jgi:hypothetical protein
MSVPGSRKRKRLLCRLNLKHNWARRFNPEGQDYTQCKACGKEPYEFERPEPYIVRGASGFLSRGW